MSSGNDIKKLTPYQHVRKRTEMYFGSRTPAALTAVNWTGTKLESQEVHLVSAIYTCFREIFDNALDEVIGHGHGTRIDITFDEKNMRFSVKDDGRGIPIDWDENEKLHKATMALSQLMTGRNFEERGTTVGVNGIGASGVNFCSQNFRLQIIRDGKRFDQHFAEGSELFDELQINEPRIVKTSSLQTGTHVDFALSPSVFSSLLLPSSFVYARVFEVAANHPSIKFSFNGEIIKVRHTMEKTLFTGVPHVKVMVDKPDFLSVFYLVPNFTPEGESVHSLVNDIPAYNGGYHIDVFKRLFFSNLIKALERESRRRLLTPNRSDIGEGILIYNVTSMRAPNFDSQSKTRLINQEVEGLIRGVMEDEGLYKEIIKTHREWIDQIYARCAARTQKKDDQEIAKISRKMLRTKVPKLMDATGRDRSKCILLLTEGDSAVSSASAVRDPEIHGGLPLRGKILNVRGESNKAILDNAIIQDIMSSIGLTIGGGKVDRKELRYGQVWITCDADQDGANIMALLVNLFYLHWPELFDPALPPFFTVFSTPFIIQEDKKKVRHYWYSDNYQDYNGDDWKGCPAPTRAKGLGSLEEIDWANSLLKPKLIPLQDDGKLGELLDLLFNGKRANDRKNWMAI